MIVLVGASASGKSVVVKKMNELYGIEKIVTYTTRPMRVGEINHVDYHFVTQEDFLIKKENNYFVDISNNKVLIVEPNGANIYYQKLKGKVFIVFLKASDKTRKERMIERGDTLEIIEKRLSGDIKYFDVSNFDNIDIMVDTENISIDEVASIIYNKYEELFIK